MNARDHHSVEELMQTMGQQAKAASTLMARASSASKAAALKALARLLREFVEPLQTENAKDIERAKAAGLAEPMVDRLKLTPKVIETCAEGCEQLAAMPDVIGVEGPDTTTAPTTAPTTTDSVTAPTTTAAPTSGP